MRFLIVDDELVSRKKLERILLSFGECVVEVQGEKGVDLYIQSWQEWNPFDFIFLDIGLPGKSGLDILAEIRKLENEKNVPKCKRAKILIVSSHADREHVAKALKANCDGYIVKPFDKNIIFEKIEDIFRKNDILRLNPKFQDIF